MHKIGLVLEGGGMRGLYTAGVLDFFLEQDLYFDYVVGVSAGACNATSYISRQKGRNKVVNTAFVNDWRYLSVKSLLINGSLFGLDFLFDEIPNRLVPFDFEAFYRSPVTFKIGTTDCETGKPVYFEKEDLDRKCTVLRASCSLPLVSPIVHYRGYDLLDGGISDPIPIRQAMADGYQKNVVVLTRNQGYQKEPVSFSEQIILKTKYRNYPELINTILKRHDIYNETLKFVDDLEEQGQVVVIRPSRKLEVDRFEKNVEKLLALYSQGYDDAVAVFEKVKLLFGR